MQIEPQYIIPLVYQIADPSDSTLYYVRAVIRNSLTGATIKTIDLTHQGGGRYTSSTQAPQDQTGQGFHIDVSITVYTDSDYTVYSSNYERKTDKYLVKRNAMVLGGSMGADIDYEKIHKLIVSEIKNVMDVVSNVGKFEKTDITPILGSIDTVKSILLNTEKVKIPEIIKTDLSSVLNRIDLMQKSIERKIVEEDEKPEAPDQDVIALVKAVDEVKATVSEIKPTIESMQITILSNIKNSFESVLSVIKENKSKLGDALKELFGASIDFGSSLKKEEKKESPVDKYFKL